MDVDADECVQVDMAVFVDVGHAFHNCVRVCASGYRCGCMNVCKWDGFVCGCGACISEDYCVCVCACGYECICGCQACFSP